MRVFDEIVCEMVAAWQAIDPDDEVLSRLEAELIATAAGCDSTVEVDEREALRLAVLTSKAEVAGLADELLQPMRQTARWLCGSLAFGQVRDLAQRYVG